MSADEEVANPRREGWFARDQWRKSSESAERKFTLPFFQAPKYPAGTPERAEWEAGWKDLDDAEAAKKTHPGGDLMTISFPPSRRYKCGACGAVYDGMYHCQSLSQIVPIDDEQFLSKLDLPNIPVPVVVSPGVPEDTVYITTAEDIAEGNREFWKDFNRDLLGDTPVRIVRHDLDTGHETVLYDGPIKGIPVKAEPGDEPAVNQEFYSGVLGRSYDADQRPAHDDAEFFEATSTPMKEPNPFREAFKKAVIVQEGEPIEFVAIQPFPEGSSFAKELEELRRQQFQPWPKDLPLPSQGHITARETLVQAKHLGWDSQYQQRPYDPGPLCTCGHPSSCHKDSEERGEHSGRCQVHADDCNCKQFTPRRDDGSR